MTLEPEWPRIGGIHYADDGTLAAAWLAHDKETDRVRVYDCAVFRREVLEVIASGLNARGNWIPIAWPENAKALSNKLLYEHGVNVLPEPVEADAATSEMTTRDIWSRMRGSRFTFNDALAELKAEYESFRRDDSQIPDYPLMAAVRHAVACLSYARRKVTRGSQRTHYPTTSIV